MTAIDESFGSWDAFIDKLKIKIAGVQGPGWAWLVFNNEAGALEIVTTLNQNSLLFNNSSMYTPLFTLNFWIDSQHLKDLVQRSDNYYDMWQVINWKKV